MVIASVVCAEHVHGKHDHDSSGSSESHEDGTQHVHGEHAAGGSHGIHAVPVGGAAVGDHQGHDHQGPEHQGHNHAQ